jgi:hypothetical protein
MKKDNEYYHMGYQAGIIAKTKADKQNAKEGYKVITEHSDNCAIVGSNKYLKYLLRNRPTEDSKVWYRIICNDPICEYEGFISDNCMSYLIEGIIDE